MSNKLQTLDSIGRIGETGKEGTDNPAKKEYEAGREFVSRQEYGQAAVALHNALVGFEEIKDEVGIANASNQLGHVCLARNEYQGALNHYQRALLICKKSNDRMSVLAVLKKIVAAYKGLKQYDQLRAACLDMIDLYQDNRDVPGTISALEEMADAYMAMGQREKAADVYRTIGGIHKNFRHDTTAAAFMEKAAKVLGES
jgi:tetratricopeptide (TPR) repeat protein